MIRINNSRIPVALVAVLAAASFADKATAQSANTPTVQQQTKVPDWFAGTVTENGVKVNWACREDRGVAARQEFLSNGSSIVRRFERIDSGINAGKLQATSWFYGDDIYVQTLLSSKSGQSQLERVAPPADQFDPNSKSPALNFITLHYRESMAAPNGCAPIWEAASKNPNLYQLVTRYPEPAWAKLSPDMKPAENLEVIEDRMAKFLPPKAPGSTSR